MIEKTEVQKLESGDVVVGLFVAGKQAASFKMTGNAASNLSDQFGALLDGPEEDIEYSPKPGDWVSCAGHEGKVLLVLSVDDDEDGGVDGFALCDVYNQDGTRPMVNGRFLSVTPHLVSLFQAQPPECYR